MARGQSASGKTNNMLKKITRISNKQQIQTNRVIHGGLSLGWLTTGRIHPACERELSYIEGGRDSVEIEGRVSWEGGSVILQNAATFTFTVYKIVVVMLFTVIIVIVCYYCHFTIITIFNILLLPSTAHN